ncbi:hypothetical protein H0H92_005441 [Tricholoma furcatifolium]|nr:hypothetical protein H0H92_005441 [Tricholoma furcatifolium]
MKFSLLTALAAAAAVAQVGATPIRVFIASSGEVDPANANHFRFGHAAANSPVATLVRPDEPKIKVFMSHSIPEHLEEPQEGKHKGHGGCRGSRFRQKAVEISNSIRKAFGFPLIETHHGMHAAPQEHEEGRIRILPFIGAGAHTSFIEEQREGGKGPHPGPHPGPPGPHHPHPHKEHHHKHHDHEHHHPDHHHPDHHHHHHHPGKHRFGLQRLANAPFVRRLHVALLALGPWEGRAVAFVLGCGLGVLLRMFWVLAVVSYRMIRGPRDEGREYTQVLFVEAYNDEEPVAAHAPISVAPGAVAPPAYPDEKKDKDQVAQ